VLRLLRVYRGRLPDRLNKQDRALFLYRDTGSSSCITNAAGGPPVWRYLFKSLAHGATRDAREASSAADPAGHAQSTVLNGA
jgi:hypothetical protein